MGAIRWETRGTRPPTFSDCGDIIYHVPHIFLFRFRNILVSHQAVPLTFYNKYDCAYDSVTGQTQGASFLTEVIKKSPRPIVIQERKMTAPKFPRNYVYLCVGYADV